MIRLCVAMPKVIRASKIQFYDCLFLSAIWNEPAQWNNELMIRKIEPAHKPYIIWITIIKITGNFIILILQYLISFYKKIPNLFSFCMRVIKVLYLVSRRRTIRGKLFN